MMFCSSFSHRTKNRNLAWNLHYVRRAKQKVCLAREACRYQ